MIDLAALGPTALLPFILIGFAAQLVDGALGMAFGVICNTLLVAVMGVPPATASARIHIVEMFTTGVSGISHLLHRNIERSEEHTSELQSLMRISYAVFCLKKKQ